MPIIDLRSDTVTLPTTSMRGAMLHAELGDDVFGEDPTVNRLEKMAAGRVGKEAALFVPSGTMANLVSLLVHCGRGEEVILGDLSHIFLNEAGGLAALGGLHPHVVPNRPDGTMGLEEIEGAVRGDNVHWPRTRLICLENTHNRCSGAPLSLDYTRSVQELAARHGLKLHVDGARIFNAAAALKVDVKFLAEPADSVSFCLSKGLCAPVGSLACGSQAFVHEARRMRKVLGGGMRQAGVLAAAGIVALEQQTERITEDHANARRLAEGIAKVPGLDIDPDRVKTNILHFELSEGTLSEETFMERLQRRGVKVLRIPPSTFRMVTHQGIRGDDVEKALDALREVMKR